MSTSSRMNRQKNKTSPTNQKQVTPFVVPNPSAAMVTRSMHNHVQLGTIAGQQVPTMAMGGFFPPQVSHTLEHALIKSIDLINTQAALLTPMTQQAMQINQSIMKMHEDNQEERRKIEEEHRAERRKADEEHRAERRRSDEEHAQRMLEIMDKFKDVVDAIQTIPKKMASSGGAREATASKLESSNSIASVPKVSISKVAKRTGSPVSPRSRKEDGNQSSSTNNRTKKRFIFVKDEMVGKGEVYDGVNKKFISFKCTFCNQIFYSERRLVVHYHDRHEEDEEPKPKKNKK